MSVISREVVVIVEVSNFLPPKDEDQDKLATSDSKQYYQRSGGRPEGCHMPTRVRQAK